MSQSSPTPDGAAGATANRGALTLIGLVAVGAAVAVALGVYGSVHTPTGVSVNVAWFSGPLEMKVWLASLASLLAIGQVLSALAMYGRLPGVRAPAWVPAAHRWSGRAAFLVSVPVALHCLYALGFQSYDSRTLAHSLLGCAFYGAFTVKMLVLTRRGLPGWVLPVAGAAVFTSLAGLWLTSSLWFFTTIGVRF